MMNGAATSMVSKKHTRIAPNTGCAESKNALDTSTDVIFLKKQKQKQITSKNVTHSDEDDAEYEEEEDEDSATLIIVNMLM